mmetsp:Transcript_90376/g.276775  ORF Transcript_90376/g.276775 Transcript_90376/m.276775 type:complete len:211 (+) Transcript_90376:103-735(+)
MRRKVVQDGLRHDKDDQGKQEPQFQEHEGADGDPAPHRVSDHDHDGVAHDLGVAVVRDPLGGLAELSLRIDHQVLYVIVHPAQPVLGRPGAPDQTVEQGGHQSRRVDAEPLDDVGVPFEHDVHAKIVAVPVGADCQKVLDDCFGRFQAARFYCPHQRRNGLRADLDVEHPQRALAARCASDGLPQLLRRVRVDGLHDNCGALVDHASQNP